MNKEQIRALKGFIAIRRQKDDEMGIFEVFCLLEEWFEQNPQKPVVVGLSDEQIESLFSYYDEFPNDNWMYRNKIYKKWAKTQTFAQPQQFTPNWDNAPADANTLVCRWIKSDINTAVNRDSLVFYRPKPPAPCVEVGQVWMFVETENKYRIDLIGQLKHCDFWIDCVTYRSLVDAECFTREMTDFLAKFERIGGE